jgi:hypothetical protein
MYKISGCTISLQAAVHPGALATGTQNKKNHLAQDILLAIRFRIYVTVLAMKCSIYHF